MTYDGSLYEKAIDALKARFGRESDIVAANLQAIFDAPSPASSDATGLEKLHAALHCAVSVFEELKYEGDLTSAENLRRVTAKLPMDLRRKWTEHALSLEPQRPSLRDLDDWLGKQVRILINCAAILPPNRSDKSSKGPRRTIVAATQVNEASSRKICTYCGRNNHDVQECRNLGSASPEEKRNFVRSGALCYGCLRKGHRSAQCKRRATCAQCRRRHPTSMHMDTLQYRQNESQQQDQRDLQHHQQHETEVKRAWQPHPWQQHREMQHPSHQYQQQQQQQAPQQQQTNPTGVTSCRVSGNTKAGKSALPVVPVVIHTKDVQLHTLAFLDGGSTHSFISQSLFENLNLANTPRTQLALTTVDRDVRVETQVVHHLKMTDVQGQNQMSLPPLYTVKEIPISREEFPRQADLNEWEHLRDIELPVRDDNEVGLLLGANAHLAMEPLEVLPSREGSPYAVRTRYGWIVVGATRHSEAARVNRIAVREEMSEIEENIRDMYNHEYEERLHSTRKGLSEDDKRFMKMVEATKGHNEGHYEVGIPLADEKIKLPDNVEVAKRRLSSLEKKMKRNPEFADKYQQSMKEMMDKGYSEVVPDNELTRDDGKVWYLPHHAVVREDKPTKMRIVFDCAAKCEGVSLNDVLLQGPEHTNTLLDVLLRFRTDSVAFTADIEGMFNQVKVPNADRDLLRFLWWKGGDYRSGIIEHRKITVHPFGAKSSPSIACYALREAATQHGSDLSPEARRTVLENFYVDDVLKSTSDEPTAIKLIQELKLLCQRGGFKLTKFTSNSAAVVASVGPEARSKALTSWTDRSESMPEERALGVKWETEGDLLKVSVDIEKLRSKPFTKRGVLSAVSTMYDPLGMVTPTVIRGRKILQDLCKLEGSWDAEMSDQQQLSWTEWLSSLQAVEPLHIQRCLKPDGFGKVASLQLHHFSDASEWAYGSVTYARLTNEEGRIHVSFVKGTGHLAPLKGVTIPRLELMAAVTAVRTAALIEDALGVSSDREDFFWTDSTTVLRYIRNTTTRYHTFVSNRLAVIHDGSKTESWRYCPSRSNPADDVSRGVQSTRWLDGPEFLTLSQDEWPKMPPVMEIPNDPEVKGKTVCAAVKTNESTNAEDSPIERLLNHYSEKHAMLRGLAWILRVQRCLLKRAPWRSPRLEAADLQAAESTVIRWQQKQSFPEEYEDLSNGREVSRRSKIVKLCPIMTEGIVRVGGRLQNANMTSETKHPIILPDDGRLTEMIVQEAHEKTGHSGRQMVLANVRKRFWILKGSSCVRRVLGRCTVCRKHRNPESQKMANLPAERVAIEPAFTHTGMDYFGPFYVKQNRSQAKRYGVIFTCLSTRAVHVEVAEDLSADSFLCALRRFKARRVHVKTLHSDRGTNFVGGSKELKEELQKLADSENRIHRAMLKHGIEFNFNTAAASHHGGAWERQIRSIRRILDRLLNTQQLKEETLTTLLCEIESILNNRPLTPLSCDPADPEPLTPNHLLNLGTDCVAMPFGLVDRGDSCSRKRWKQVRYLSEVFWRRWRAEYLPLLQERPQAWTRSRANVRTGDIVLVVDDSVPRGQWPLGLVEDVKVGADGLVRSVDVRIRGLLLQRPVTKLVKL